MITQSILPHKKLHLQLVLFGVLNCWKAGKKYYTYLKIKLDNISNGIIKRQRVSSDEIPRATLIAQL